MDAALDAAFDDIATPAEPEPVTATATTGDVPTTEEPPQAEPTPVPEGKEGPIPFAVHKTAMENARTKAAQETEQRLLQQLQEELTPLREEILFAQNLKANKTAAIAQWLEAHKDDPDVTALLARSLAGRRGLKNQLPPQDEPEPPRFADGPNGELMFDPALDQKWREWNDRRIERQVLAKVEDQYAPIKQTFEQAQKERQAAEKFKQYQTAVETRSKERGQLWDGMPFMEKNQDGTPSPTRAAILKRQAEIATELTQQVKAGQLRIDAMELPWVALQRAYSDVVPKQGIPSLRAKEQQTLIHAAVTKTRGSQADPNASAPAQPRKARSVDEALEQAFAGIGGA
jgi:hypothetical protein